MGAVKSTHREVVRLSHVRRDYKKFNARLDMRIGIKRTRQESCDHHFEKIGASGLIETCARCGLIQPVEVIRNGLERFFLYGDEYNYAVPRGLFGGD